MPFRPEEKKSFKNGDNPPWLGFQNAKILSFKDESSKYDWADVYLIIELKTAISEYPVKMQISGSFERDENDEILNNSLLKKFYSVADAIGFGGGFSPYGLWVTATDDNIENIETFLNNNYTDNSGAEIYPYTIYVYKAKVMDKQSNEEKVWTRIVPRMAKSEDQKQMKNLESYVTWAKNNDVIVEHKQEDTPDPWDKDADKPVWNEKTAQTTSAPSIRTT